MCPFYERGPAIVIVRRAEGPPPVLLPLVMDQDRRYGTIRTGDALIFIMTRPSRVGSEGFPLRGGSIRRRPSRVG